MCHIIERHGQHDADIEITSRRCAVHDPRRSSQPTKDNMTTDKFVGRFYRIEQDSSHHRQPFNHHHSPMADGSAQKMDVQSKLPLIPPEKQATVDPDALPPKLENMILPNEQKIHGMGPATFAVNTIISPYNSFCSNLKESLANIVDISPELRNIAEGVFCYMDEETNDENVFLNVPNLMQVLILLASVSHSQPSKEIKKLLLRFKKKLEPKDLQLRNNETTRLVCARASRDLIAWDINLRNQCIYNEYQTRRRLYVNYLACRSYSFRTFQALNTLLMEVKLNHGGQEELDTWAMGPEKYPSGTRNIFKTWNPQERAQIEEIERKEKKSKKAPLPTAIKGNLQTSTRETAKVPAGVKCPILMASTHLEIPVHPFVLDMRCAYTMCKSPSPMRALRFINDSSRMLKYFKIGTDHRGVRIPCRLKEENTYIQLMIFWSSQMTKRYYNILSLVDAVIGGLDTSTQYNGKVEEMSINELHMPMWERNYEASNLAQPIAKRVTDHLFAEGGFGDLASRSVRPSAEATGVEAPSIQSFDHLVIRTPTDEETTHDLDSIYTENIEEKTQKAIVRVSLPYYMVIWDDRVKSPIYFGRISKPLLETDTIEEPENNWRPCNIS